MSQSRIMLVCESCADNYPEGCGHYSTSDLRVAPDKRWLCEGCFDDEPDFRGKRWTDLKRPSKTAALAAVRSMFLPTPTEI